MKQRLSVNLKMIRKERWRMSQDRFSQLMGSTRSKINSYENGGVEPSIAFILQLQEFTNIPALELFYDDLQADQIPTFPIEKNSNAVGNIESKVLQESEFEKLSIEHKATQELLERLDQRLVNIQKAISA